MYVCYVRTVCWLGKEAGKGREDGRVGVFGGPRGVSIMQLQIQNPNPLLKQRTAEEEEEEEEKKLPKKKPKSF